MRIMINLKFHLLIFLIQVIIENNLIDKSLMFLQHKVIQVIKINILRPIDKPKYNLLIH